MMVHALTGYFPFGFQPPNYYSQYRQADRQMIWSEIDPVIFQTTSLISLLRVEHTMAFITSTWYRLYLLPFQDIIYLTYTNSAQWDSERAADLLGPYSPIKLLSHLTIVDIVGHLGGK